MQTNPQYKILHPNADDFSRVILFMISCDVAEFGAPDTDEGDTADQWQEADPPKDIWLAENAAGDLCGYAIINSTGSRGLTFDLYTLPDATGLAVRERLVGLVLERAKEMVTMPTTLTTYVSGFNPANRECMESRGFAVHTIHYRMQIDFSTPLAPINWPAEYSLHSVTEQDKPELYTLINAAFDWPGRSPVSFEDWERHLFRDGRYDPNYFILVRKEGRLVAAALSYNEGNQGWVRQLAVTKELQGKGLGSMLLRHVFSLYSQQGAKSVALGVELENEKAAAFYDHLGMHRSREFLEYRIQVG
jgi:ribosomal protein S18 acetylase RimI-like enzyme